MPELTLPAVSVIVPFLNPGPFLLEAIQSVMAQTEYDWELLLVDDGTTDGSLDIARSYVETHPEKVFYLAHPGRQNCGVSASRNLGLRRARGSYIAFLDADDVWMPNKLKRQRHLLDSYPSAAMVYGPALYWFDWAGKAEDQSKNFEQDTGVSVCGLIAAPKLVEMYLRNSDIIPSASAVFLRRQAALAVGGFVDEFRRAIYDDQVFYTKLAFREAILIDDEGYFKYRQHPASGCAIASRSGLEPTIRIQFLIWLRNYMAQNNIADARIKKIVVEELRNLAGSRASLSGFARAAVPSALRKFLRSRITKAQV
jgi:glycosyltransferase involved in cell wall biosynthesis